MLIAHAGRIPMRREWRMPLHVHDVLDELIVVVGGEIRTQILGQTIVGRSGDVLHYPRGAPHAEAAGPDGIETMYVAFRMPVGVKLPLVSRDRAGHVLAAAQWMLSLGATGKRRDLEIADRLLEAILHELAGGMESPESDMVRRVRRFVEHRLAEPLTLARLAEEAGMSKFHFARVFAQTTGQSPMAYVRQARVNAARVLLRTSALPLKAIAPLVGLGDQTQFSRVFKRVTGETPGKVRG